MFEFRTDLIAGVSQVPSVNCQLIMRSELLELPCIELMARIRNEADENSALEVEYELPVDDIPEVSHDYSAGRNPADSPADCPSPRLR